MPITLPVDLTTIYHYGTLLSMETREIYEADAPSEVSKHLRMPTRRLQWFIDEARRQGRSVTAEMNMALEHWQKTRRLETMDIPEEKDLNITAEDVAWDRKFIQQHEAAIKEYEAKAAASRGPRRGAYRGMVTKTKKNLDAMSGNLGYHLDWLRRFKPDVYREIQEGE